MSGTFKTGDPSGYKDGLEKALLKVATKIQNQAKAFAPVGLTGDLRRSIESGMIDDKTSFVSAGGAGTGVDYEKHVEYGTKNQAAQPYMRPAVYVVANPGTGKAVAEALNLGMRKTLRNKKTRKV